MPEKNRTSSLYPAFGADFPDWQHLYDLPGTSVWWKRNHSHDCSWRCAFSEIAATAACFLALGVDFSRENYHPLSGLWRQPRNPGSVLSSLKEIGEIAVPHSANRLLLTVLSGIEMVLIPQQLLLAGMTQTDALAVYGIFTGMALPLILFPATITNSASVMLMPSVAGLQALGYEKRIRYVIWRTLGTCFFFGAFCTLFFFLLESRLEFFCFTVRLRECT